MERLAELATRLERAQLQLKSLQRTARTTLQVTADLSAFVDETLDEIREEITHSPEEGTANDKHRRSHTVAV